MTTLNITAPEAAAAAHDAIDDIGAVGYHQQAAAARAHEALYQFIGQAVKDAAYGAASQAVHQAGAAMDDDRRDTLRAMAQQIAKEAADSASPVILAAGLGVAAGRRIAKHWTAQAAGTADAFGLDPDDRIRSWEGRYDGAA